MNRKNLLAIFFQDGQEVLLRGHGLAGLCPKIETERDGHNVLGKLAISLSALNHYKVGTCNICAGEMATWPCIGTLGGLNSWAKPVSGLFRHALPRPSHDFLPFSVRFQEDRPNKVILVLEPERLPSVARLTFIEGRVTDLDGILVLVFENVLADVSIERKTKFQKDFSSSGASQALPHSADIPCRRS
jgi:hypothetical protein